MTQTATEHTASNDGITMYEVKKAWKQMIVHSFRVVYQHLFTRRTKFMTQFRSEHFMSWPRFAPNTCPIKAGSSTA